MARFRRRSHRRSRHNPSMRHYRRRGGGRRRRNPFGYGGDLTKKVLTAVGTVAAQLIAHKAIFGQSYQTGLMAAASKAVAGGLVAWGAQRFNLISPATAGIVRDTSITVAVLDYGRQLADAAPMIGGGPFLNGLRGLGRTVTVAPSSAGRLDGFGRTVTIAPSSAGRLDGLRGLVDISRRPAQFSGGNFGGVMAVSRGGRLPQF